MCVRQTLAASKQTTGVCHGHRQVTAVHSTTAAALGEISWACSFMADQHLAKLISRTTQLTATSLLMPRTARSLDQPHLATLMFWYEPRMCILVSAMTILVFVAFSIVNLVLPFCVHAGR